MCGEESLVFYGAVCVVCLGCPSGWTVTENKCFIANHTQMSWYAARLACERHGANLAVVEDTMENDIVTQLKTSHAWIGLTNSSGTWAWADDAKSLTYSNWNTNEPNSSESCVYLFHSESANGTWGNARCESPMEYICMRYHGM